MPAPDDFASLAPGMSGPAAKAVSLVPSNGTDLGFATRGIYVGGGGDLRVDMQDGGAAITFVAVAAGSVLPIRVSRVYATGTTATSLIGLR
jgi:hypothetical protein